MEEETGTRDWEQRTGNRELVTGSLEKGERRREKLAGSREQGAGSRCLITWQLLL